MKAKWRGTAVILIYIVLMLGGPNRALFGIEFRDIWTDGIFVYLGYWFIFRSDYLYNSYVLIRYPNKRDYYGAFISKEATNAVFYVTAFVGVTILARTFGVLLYPLPGGVPPMNLGRVLLFEIVSIVNLILLRFVEQLVSMAYKRIAGNIFFISYVFLDILFAFLFGGSEYNMDLFITSQLFREYVINVPEIICSYGIVFSLMAVLVFKNKKGSVSV